ncbi:hypothetical protein JQ604_28180 [Bradyrhizobium jicamae]|uniref:hypothetical protein n=1 Tax=Bradyrhizobium jicamae TaxID=280332 RepID=UPI001BAC919C|nr:hypothetical protein [Bradyrhizobium jicamae]MBR0756070.1 hypothetical protein [Bradyrhizobium jicamae]
MANRAATLTPAKIIWTLRQFPALERDAFMASEYLGQRVAWKTRFFDVIDYGAGSIKLFSLFQRGWHRHARFDRSVYAHIDINSHPETRDLRRGRRVDLGGTIAAIDIVTGITLTLDRFEILPVSLLDRFVIKSDSRY